MARAVALLWSLFLPVVVCLLVAVLLLTAVSQPPP
jgi:hypothetical protein